MLFLKDKKSRYFNFILLILVIVFLKICFFKGSKQPNIILITIDGLRADHLSCYGYGRLTTPNVDKLAKDGVIFLQAIAPSTETAYSIPAMITSTYSHYNGIDQWRDTLINPSARTLSEMLLNNGYYAAFFSNGYPLGLIKGIDREMKDFMVDENISAEKLTSISMDWLKLNQNRKFFLWIHYFDTHSPYSPPPPYNTLFIKDELDINDKNIPIASFDKDWAGFDIIPYSVARNNITSVNYYISQYDGAIRFTDEQIGVLLDKLRELKLYENTIIVITADHGENLGEHNRYFQHGGMPFDTLLHVPLIFKYESAISKNKKIKTQVSSAGIVPTLLDMLKIKRSGDIDEKSFLGLAQDKIENYNPYVFSKCAASIYSIRTEKYKLIWLVNSDKYSLYDLHNDKDELYDVKDIKKEEFDFLRNKLRKWFIRNRSSISPKMPPFDKDTIDKLRSLGYL
ncbi:MAG: sulfatase [Candidatus Omnitrophota bacterium]|nr:sulfatase [Candidatus Omnitrophota bacterium]